MVVPCGMCATCDGLGILCGVVDFDPAAHEGVKDVEVVVVYRAFSAAEYEDAAVDLGRGVCTAGGRDVANSFGVGPLHGFLQVRVYEWAGTYRMRRTERTSVKC